MGQFAVGAVGVGPLLEQRQDLGLFPLEQTIDRVPARGGIIERKTGLAAGVPPLGPLSIQPQHGACLPGGPATGNSVIDDREQLGFHGP
jgi:hypothetical protein